MSTTTAATVSNRASVSRQPNFFAHDVHLRHETQVLGCHRGPVADTTGRQLTPDAANEPPTNDLETLQARDQLLSGLRKRVELRGFEPLTPSMRTQSKRAGHRPKL